MLDGNLTRDELVLVAKHRRCDIGGTVTVGGQKFRMCMLSSNSVYMHRTGQKPGEHELVDVDLSQDELVLVAIYRKCEVGEAITIGKQKFLKCISTSNSIYMREITPQSEPQLAA